MAEGLKTGDEIVPVYHSNFGLQVYVENVDKNISEEDVWRQMEIESDGSVIHKRLTRDPMCESTLRATIIYNDNSYVSKVAKEIDGQKVGAHIIRADIASNKVELLKSSETKLAAAARDGEFTGEVFVSGFSSRFEEQHLRWMFEKFGFKSVTVMRNCNGESTGAAIVKLSCWNFAMRAEIAFDGIAVEGGSKLYVIARRNRQQKVCLPWKLVEVMMENNPVTERSTTSRSLELKLSPTVTEQQSTAAATLASGTVLFELGVQLGTDKIEGEIDSDLKESKLSETDGTERGTQENQSGLEAENGGQKDNAEISVCDVKKKSYEIENNVKASYGGEKASLSESNGKEQTDIENGSQGTTAAEPTPAQKLEQIGHSMRKLSAKKHRHVYFGAIGKEDEAEMPEERELEESPVSTESTDRSSGLGLQFHMEMDDIEERSTCRCRDVCQCTCNCEGACQCHCECKDYCSCRNRR